MRPLLDGLDDSQRAAVTHRGSDLVVVAAPGSGKTRVLVSRAAWLVDQGAVEPTRLALVTFTRAAAAEMRGRLRGIGGPAAGTAHVVTFNALGMRLLTVLARLGVDGAGWAYLSAARARSWRWALALPPSPVFPMAAGVARAGVSDQQLDDWYGQVAAARADGASVDAPPAMAAEAVALWRAWERCKQAHRLLDLDDQVEVPVRAAADPAVARALRSLFDVVLVDEVQDANRVQLRLAELLAPPGGLTLVGDPDQSIYDFRGARPDALLSWRDGLAAGARGPVAVVHINRCYRSLPAVVGVARRLIAHNDDAGRVPMVPVRAGGWPVDVVHGVDPDDEARRVIARVAAASGPPGQCAVLVRTRRMLGPLLQAAADVELAVSVPRGEHYLDLAPMQAVTAFAKAAAGDQHALLDLLGTAPPFGVGSRRAAELARVWPSRGWPDVRRLGVDGVSRRVAALLAALEGLDGDAEAGRLLRELGAVCAAATAVGRAGEQARAVLAQEAARARGITVSEYLARLARVARFASVAQRRNTPWLSTIHAAKGLEWARVQVAGCVEGALPHVRAVDDAAVAQERRLFFVAMTRARDYLAVTRPLTVWEAGGDGVVQVKAVPSRFLAEAGVEG